MTAYPGTGQSPWGEQLKTYIDQGDARSEAAQTAAETSAAEAEAANESAQIAQSAAVGAATSASASATSAAASADTASQAAEDAVAVGTGDLDPANAVLINLHTSDTAGALAENYAGRGSGSSEARSVLPGLMTDLRAYNDITAPVKRLIGMGSSVGNGASLPDPATQAPPMRLFSRMEDALNRTGAVNFTKTNGSVDGSVIIQAVNGDDHYGDAKTEAGGVPDVLALFYGMNDGASASYHAGQTYPSFYTFGKQLIEDAQADGAEVILFTTPHPHSERITWTLPNGVPASYAGTGTGPTATLTPASTIAASIVTVTSPSGVEVPASYRYLRINDSIRALAHDTGSLLIDIEGYWFDAIAKYGEDALYNTGEVVHPNLLGHQESYWRGIEDFVQGLIRGGVGAAPYIPPVYVPPATGPDELLFTGSNGAYGSFSPNQVLDYAIPANTYGVLTLLQNTGDGLREHTVVEVVAKATTVGVSTYRTSFTGSAPSNIASVTTSGLNVRVTIAAPHAGGTIKWSYAYRNA